MRPRPRIFVFFCLVFAMFGGNPAFSQTANSLSGRNLDETRLVTLHGTVHPLAQAQYDRGPVPDSFTADRMLVLLTRPANQDGELRQFLRNAHTLGSADYHHWLTPNEFGIRFGPADENIQTIVSWLQSHGFTVPRVSNSKAFIEFSGTAAQVREALHAQIHQYEINSETHYSIANEVAIPEALAPLIRGFAPLNTFALTSYVHEAGPAAYSPVTKRAKPLFTTSANGQNFYALAPEDFATQYNLSPAYKAGTDGTGQTIGIIGRYNVDLSLVDAYRKLFNLPADNTQVIIDGEDPGDPPSPNIEGFLDVEVSGAVAPKAAINFYIAGGSPFLNPVLLAALRAVEDNQAAILSVSFGQCEKHLGPNGNQFWASLWEQAAAQGQTVLVASGDSGPAGCDFASFPGAFQGLAVNGLASTPWNVAVGGTDFYYSDYASGAPSITSLWNRSNDSNLGSLKAPLPEQPWNPFLGLNIPPPGFFVFLGVPPPVAAGGGASNCVQFTTILPGPSTCAGGYTKPSWQSAPGVPSDGVRDLPDISLFASSGANLTAYPICVRAGDCTVVAAGEPQVFLVGGTSASTPAMAGVMALINQKFGRQGQADFSLYALARQIPAIFHDIGTGSNDVYCRQGSPDCVNQLSASAFSFGKYAAAPGYDLASGLGSFDANALISNWSKISYLPTTTTLQLSPSTIVHGAPVQVTASVQAVSGPSIPSGDVNIAINAPASLPESGTLSLSNGSAVASIPFFPGGTYQVTAQYAGDGVFATSTSSPATLTVTPETSLTSLAVRYYYIDYAGLIPHIGTVQNGDQVPYGSVWTFEAQPAGQSSLAGGKATGAATFTDGSASVQVPINSAGFAAWSPQILTVGSHSASASYSGDASYSSSSSAILNFTVVKGTPQLSAFPEAIGTAPFHLQAGADLVVHVTLRSVNTGVPPSGNVTVNFGSLMQTVPLSAISYMSSSLAVGFVAFANVPAGTYALSASYLGDSNWNSASFSLPQPLIFDASNLVATTAAVAVSPATVTSSQIAAISATVQAGAGATSAPTGLVEFYANGSLFALGALSPQNAPNSTAAIASAHIPGSGIPLGTDQIVAYYGGTLGFGRSTSAQVSLTVTAADFTMSPATTRLTIKSGLSAAIPLLLGGPSGASVSIALACIPSSSSIGCSVNPSSSSVAGSATSTLTINAFVPGSASAATYQQSNDIRSRLFVLSGTFVLGLVFLPTLRGRKRKLGLLLSLAISALASFAVGCGGGSSYTTGPPPPQNISAPPGAYSVLVIGTSGGGASHSTKLTVTIQ